MTCEIFNRSETLFYFVVTDIMLHLIEKKKKPCNLKLFLILKGNLLVIF